MLLFVSKKRYWDIEKKGGLGQLRGESNPNFVQRAIRRFGWQHSPARSLLATGELKHVQDAVAFDMLRLSENKTIAEIGGGHSRVLPAISKANRCINIEPFEGAGNGLKKSYTFPGVENVPAMIGDYAPLLAPAFFDIIYSISVVEHVPSDKLDDFFRDCARILKPGGLMLHLIDMYLADSPDIGGGNVPRLKKYKAAINAPLFAPLDPSQMIEDQAPLFRTSYATNADNVLQIWNRGGSPELKALRESAQSCSILLQAIRTDAAIQLPDAT